VPGLRFRFDTNESWPYPNPTGLQGVMEGFCPPHYSDMRKAVNAVCDRKFGPGGPYNSQTPGPWKDSSHVRSSAQYHDDTFRECVALQAQYIYDTFGKFPGTVPSIFVTTYLQAHHLDLNFTIISTNRVLIWKHMPNTLKNGINNGFVSFHIGGVSSNCTFCFYFSRGQQCIQVHTMILPMEISERECECISMF